MRRIPLALRLALAFGAMLTVLLLAAGLFLYDRLGSDLGQAQDGQLAQQAQDLTAVVASRGQPLRASSSLRTIETGESFAEVLDEQGRVVDATPTLGGARLLARIPNRQAYVNIPSAPDLDEPARLLIVPTLRDGRRATLIVGATRQNRQEALDSLRSQLLLGGPPLLLGLTTGGFLLVRAALRPVEAIRSEAARISATRPGRRLPVPPARDELHRLGETLNAMLDRLEAALERERTFVANASHELRTPLATLRTELELALRRPRTTAQLQAAIASAVEEAERLGRLAENLLQLARSDAGALPLGMGDVDLRSLVGRVGRRAGLALEAPAVILRADPAQLEQALGNLLVNAARHGGGRVALHVLVDDDDVELCVTDEGPGFPVDYLPKAFDRFSRPRTDAEGGGLGLAIVQAVAAAHGGTCGARNRPAGGAEVWLRLPRTPGPARRTAAPITDNIKLGAG